MAATTPSTFSVIPDPILLTIAEFYIVYASDYFTLNTLNKYTRKVVKIIWNKPMTEDDYIFPRRTMILNNQCMACLATCTPLQKVVAFHHYPKGTFLYCHHFKCVRRAIKSYVNIADEHNIDLLYKPALTTMGTVQRSSGAIQECRYARRWMWKDGKIRCYFDQNGQDYVKDVFIHLIPMEFHINPPQRVCL